MEEPILKVQHLTSSLLINKQVVNIVDGISFDLYRGKTLCLVGESGSGKTLAALSLLRILPIPPALPPKGAVIYQGKNLLEVSEREMRKLRGGRIAMIFQDPTTSFNPVYTIGAQLIQSLELHMHLYGQEAMDRVIRALTEVGISSPAERLNDYPHQLSGGMRQRVMIAMALMCEPDVLIADEPTTALDVTIQAQVLDLIRQLQKSKGMAVLLITHDMGVVAEMADDVIVMYAAQAMERGEVFEIFDHMAHPYTLGLFNSRASLTHPSGKLQAIKGYAPPPLHYPKGCRFHTRCPFVMEKCRQGEVTDFTIEAKSQHIHLAKCWLYDGSDESNQRLKEK